jgi:serine/threonine-protein kinase RsbW
MSKHQDPSPIEQRLDLINDRASIHQAECRVLEALDRFDYPKSARFAIRLAFEEAVTNAFKHGHKGLPRSTPIRVDLSVGPQRVVIAIEDQGPGFNPGEVPDPTLDENLEVPTGRGLMLIRAYMSGIAFNAPGNRVEMTFDRASGTDV